MHNLSHTACIAWHLLKAQVTDLQDPLERGLIEPTTLACGSPTLFVMKKTGELRMVVDYGALNN